MTATSGTPDGWKTRPMRTAAAYALVLLSPALAWSAWVSWDGGYASNAMSVLWFVTVALGCLISGILAPRSKRHYFTLVAIATVSTIVTLYLWWSSEDETGLFMVGIIIVAPLVLVASGVVLLIGRLLARFTRGPTSGGGDGQ
ncbi:hypothetical protein [Spelaeicoccus albus]|uniref:Putative membrane protein n=1 Tax=Spelaeicoccus albus TaxID=1280376 RepID=A0A7Z0D5C4_9MICO|nr:hypothetical protein [Spelaeicoccus albus]NYI69195.1 putative membrane protein [Spelaeicoccus albus]